MTGFAADPNLLAHAEAAKFVGCCPRFLTNCCRSGAIPWPTDPWGRFPLEQLVTLKARFLAKGSSRDAR